MRDWTCWKSVSAIGLTSLVVGLAACGGGGSDGAAIGMPNTGSTQTPTPTSPIPAAVPVTTYTCDTAAANNSCMDSSYTFKTTISPSAMTQYLTSRYSAGSSANSTLMACKQSSACAANYASGMSLLEIQALQRASTAVVRLSMPNDHYTDGQVYGIFYTSSCSGTVVRNTLDSSVYIVTAAHCLYEHPLYPNVIYGSYRYEGLPIYVTFFYEKNSCGGQLDFSLFASYTVPAIPIAYNYSLNGWSAPGWNNASGEITDFALLKLAGPLPPGVTPVAVNALPLSTTDTFFTFSHPFGLDKSGGFFDGGPVLAEMSGYQYVVSASRRLTEPGSSGGPLFAYNAAKNSVTLIGTQSGASNPSGPAVDACNTAQNSVYGRLDRHASFLSQYLGSL